MAGQAGCMFLQGKWKFADPGLASVLRGAKTFGRIFFASALKA